MKRDHWLLCCIILSCPCETAFGIPQGADSIAGDELRSFPGAEGFGAYARGGREGEVVHVTHLGDSGAGSLRNGVTDRNFQGSTPIPRTVVFDISGTIVLQSPLIIDTPFLTLAGQTAPGMGVTLRGYETQVSGTQHIVVRFMRFRPGDEHAQAAGNRDSITAVDSEHVIFDHLSASWSMDELVGTWFSADYITYQWCVIASPLDESLHPKTLKTGELHGYAVLLGSDIDHHFSLHHNVIAHARGRLPYGWVTADHRTGFWDIRNNVIYNWGNSYPGLFGAQQNPNSRININYVGNYLKAGSDTQPNHVDHAIRESSGNVQAIDLYLAGNLINGSAFGPDAVRYEGNMQQVGTAHGLGAKYEIHTSDVGDAYWSVLKNGGATVPARDSVDKQVMLDVQNGTGQIINCVNDDLKRPECTKNAGGWPDLPVVSRPSNFDTDQDGMPNTWELARGLNPADASDRNGDDDADGYTNLEEYLSDLAGNWR